MLCCHPGSPASQHCALAAVCPLPAAFQVPAWVTRGPWWSLPHGLMGSGRSRRVPPQVDQGPCCGGLPQRQPCCGVRPALPQLSAQSGFLCMVTVPGGCSSGETLAVAVTAKNLGFWVGSLLCELGGGPQAPVSAVFVRLERMVPLAQCPTCQCEKSWPLYTILLFGYCLRDPGEGPPLRGWPQPTV